jgi:hypothetical protein
LQHCCLLLNVGGVVLGLSELLLQLLHPGLHLGSGFVVGLVGQSRLSGCSSG